MDTVVYLATAALTILWSVWVYIAWSDRAKLPEDATMRFLLIVLPSVYFLIIALAGWTRAMFIRLDLIGLLALDGITIAFVIIMLLVLNLGSADRKGRFLVVVTLYNAAALGVIAVVYLIRLFPPFLIRLASLIDQMERINLFRLAWIGLNPETNQQDLAGMLNKIVIAMFSYIPISVIRMVYISRNRRKLEREIAELRRNLADLERKFEEV